MGAPGRVVGGTGTLTGAENLNPALKCLATHIVGGRGA